jgi:pSer/pThr/pTyr-binding forkhead associated (FHA) protein
MSVTQGQERQHPPRFDVVPQNGWHPAVMLDRPLCVIGRDYDANLPLDGPQVSRHHALVVRDGSRVYVRDLASKNGTLHNGERVVEAELNDGDQIRLGSFTLRCATGFGYNSNGGGQAEPAGDAQDPIADFHLGGRIVPIPAGRRTFLIGRRKACDLTIDDLSVAPAHAVIFTIHGRHHVRELNTQGRTVLNDVPVHKGGLNNGDLLKIGGVTVEYRREDAAAAAAAAAPIEAVETARVAEPVAEDEAATAESTPLASFDELGALDLPVADDIASPASAEVDAEADEVIDVPEPCGGDSMIPLADVPGVSAFVDAEDSAVGAPATAEPTRARSQEPPPGVDAGDRSWSGSESAIPFALDDEDDRAAAAPSSKANQKPTRGRDDWKKQGSASPRPIPRGTRLD